MPSTVQKLVRRTRFGAPIVIVSGLPRSGTSMAMKMLEGGGMEVVADGLREADGDNPKGYFELERVKELDKGGDKSWLQEARGKSLKVISFLLEHLPEDINAQVIFMRRHLDEVLASQAKMLANRGETNDIPDDKMKMLYERHVRKVEYFMDNHPGIEWIDIQYDVVVNNPRPAAEDMNEFLGGKLDVEKMVAAVDRSLYRNRA